MFDITISTINRVEKKQYLPDTLQSLILNANAKLHKINFVVGNPDIGHLTKIKESRLANIIPISDSEWDLIKDQGSCIKFNMNFYRCLTHQVDSSVTGRLYLEDDISFKKGWDIELESIIQGIKLDTPEFALSLYTAYDLSKHQEDILEFKTGFYGTQGVFFTSGMMAGFAQYIMDKGIIVYNHMADILLQQYCLEKNIPLFVLKNSLIQHTGEESSIHNGAFHKSVTFKSE